MLDRVKRKNKQKNLWSHLCARRADTRAACLYSNKVHSHIVHQPSRCGLSDVSEAPEPSSPCALRSFQGNMCAGILPQLRQGLARSAVGTGGVWENRGSVPLSFPHRHSASFSLALVHEAASLPCPSHPNCNSSSSLFSPYILSFLDISHCRPFNLSLCSSFCLSLTSKNPFLIVSPLIFCNYAHWPSLLFFVFSFFFLFSYPLS